MKDLIKTVLFWGMAVILFGISFYVRTPFLARFRPWDAIFVISVSLLFSMQTLVSLRHRNPKGSIRIERILFFIFTTLTLCLSIMTEAEFHYKKYQVLHRPPEALQQLGKHFIVGYRDYDEIKEMVSKGAVGGVYITARNVKGKSFDRVRQEIQDLQHIRKVQGFPPLFIAADQEGGIVSRLTPPLTGLPPLSQLTEKVSDIDKIEKKVSQYAAIQGEGLARLGVNVNFSPVVDLENKTGFETRNSLTKLNHRIISTDRNTVYRVALCYCRELEKYGIFPTLKHFPGLSGVSEDTHFLAGELNTDETTLRGRDWVPFREVAQRTDAFIMLGHVRLKAIDRNDLTSYSRRVIQGVIRDHWQHDGILITDDLNMGAVMKSKPGIKGVSVKALNAGVDLLLISYDGDQYYEAMYGVIKAVADKKLDIEVLSKSDIRLEKATANLTITHSAIKKIKGITRM